jgi:hypothetical protein
MPFELGPPAHAAQEEPEPKPEPKPEPRAVVPPMVTPARASPRPATPARAAALPPSLAMVERARYRVEYGPFEVGEISIAIDGPGAAARSGDAPAVVRARGQGVGAIVGLGRRESRVETEFDPAALASRRWTMSRTDADGTVADTVDEPAAGRLAITRVRDGRAGQRTAATVPGAVLDPLGLLLRLRAAPPDGRAGPLALNLLDGQALWRVTFAAAGTERLDRDGPGRPALRFEGRADPIRYDGAPDPGERPARAFVVWLSADDARVPLRLEMPIGVSNLVASLVELERTGPPPARASRARRSVRSAISGGTARRTGGPVVPSPRFT